jgi:hypothetical protein
MMPVKWGSLSGLLGPQVVTVQEGRAQQHEESKSLNSTEYRRQKGGGSGE